MSEKLMPCPFCWSEAVIQGRGYETGEYRVYCTKCGCSTFRWSVVDVLALGVGINADRANICFDNGRLGSVELSTLRVLKMNKNTQEDET